MVDQVVGGGACKGDQIPKIGEKVLIEVRSACVGVMVAWEGKDVQPRIARRVNIILHELELLGGGGAGEIATNQKVGYPLLSEFWEKFISFGGVKGPPTR